MSVMFGDKDLESEDESKDSQKEPKKKSIVAGDSRCKTCDCIIRDGHMFCDECLESYYSGILDDLWKEDLSEWE